MNRPEVRIIEPQQEQTTPTEVTGSEAAYLLAKYGYSQPTQINQSVSTDLDNNLTFEEMVARQEEEIRREELRRQQIQNSPKPLTFDQNQVGYSNSQFRSLDIDGHNFGIQVQVVSNMPIN